ncbi:glutamine amidotransferase class I [Methylobacter tundripaludum]|uniref:CTP synthase (glutamine hydrolyzing) n=1 Tax=Methylobacter tundripaludum TaxID=173365 RepID=A0A2S6HJ23_9GAMM|nr:gamma-glutamyl-gamma-aminobutyrate hydrolase family protein [Methylobacter tundripaludum]PPK77457.1 glutamine amidotransferase class I [Methylobacter tundripaludum]
MIKSIALLGEYTPTFPPHVSTNAAINHAQQLLDVDITANWVSTEDIDSRLFEHYSGIWVAPGSPYKSMELTLWAIRYARENKIPCFGTCGGFQHMVIEYARNVLGVKGAQHAEYDPSASSLFISQLACSLAGREMQLSFEPGSRVAAIYGGLSAKEHYYCNFGVNPDCIDELKQGPLKVSGSDAEGEIRVIEHPDHPFFIGTLFVPQMRSIPERPHPLVTAFLRAVLL